MIFYLEQTKLEVEKTEINLMFEKKFSKQDKSFLKLLLNYYEKNREEFIEIQKDTLLELLKIPYAELNNFFNRFMKKKISYSVKYDGDFIGHGEFYVLSSYFIQKESVVFVFSKEILLSFYKNNFFNRINLNSILNFKNDNSLIVYLKLLNNFENKEFIEFDLENIREIFKLEGAYTRFYDFEKYVLKPILEDLNTYSEYEVSYSKIKSSLTNSAKITGINLNFINRFKEEMKNKTNEFITLVKDEIKNFDLVYKTIFDSLMKNESEYVFNNLMFTKDQYKKNFEKFLIRALNEDLYGMHAHIEEENQVIIKKNIKNLFQLHEEINKSLLKLDTPELLNPNLVGPTFYRDLHRLKDGDRMSFKNQFVKIELYYHSKEESNIKISAL